LEIVHFPVHATALGRKYPGAARDWSWQYVFPADRRSVDARSGIVRRHHISDQSFQRALPARVGSRHPHRAGNCSVIRTSGRRQSTRTCSNRGGRGAISPFDRLARYDGNNHE